MDLHVGILNIVHIRCLNQPVSVNQLYPVCFKPDPISLESTFDIALNPFLVVYFQQ